MLYSEKGITVYSTFLDLPATSEYGDFAYTQDTHKLYVYDNGWKDAAKPYANNGPTTSGVAVFYLTDDKTAAGHALFTAEPVIIIPPPNDSTSQFARSWVLSPDFKTLTVTVKKQVFNGVTVLGVNVLGTMTMNNVPNGTEISVWAIAKN